MISAGEFRNGVTMEFEGSPYVILEFQHVKPGKGAAFVRTKIKNLKTGAVLEKTFRPNEKMPKAHIDRQDMQYLYSDGDLFHFMNAENFEQIAVNASEVGDSLKFVKENDVVKILAYGGQVFGIEPALFVELKITETEPGFAGNTAQGATKPAILETGAQIQVPLFINQDEVVKIDTRTGEYLGRVTS
ncbi:MAG: elongation factor P [Anaerotignum sp.]